MFSYYIIKDLMNINEAGLAAAFGNTYKISSHYIFATNKIISSGLLHFLPCKMAYPGLIELSTFIIDFYGSFPREYHRPM